MKIEHLIGAPIDTEGHVLCDVHSDRLICPACANMPVPKKPPAEFIAIFDHGWRIFKLQTSGSVHATNYREYCIVTDTGSNETMKVKVENLLRLLNNQ